MAVHPATASAPQVTGAIRQAAQSTGISFEYLLTTANIESNFNPTAQASTSSSKGLYQFIDQTWLGTMKQDGSGPGSGSLRRCHCASARRSLRGFGSLDACRNPAPTQRSAGERHASRSPHTQQCDAGQFEHRPPADQWRTLHRAFPRRRWRRQADQWCIEKSTHQCSVHVSARRRGQPHNFLQYVRSRAQRRGSLRKADSAFRFSARRRSGTAGRARHAGRRAVFVGAAIAGAGERGGCSSEIGAWRASDAHCVGLAAAAGAARVNSDAAGSNFHHPIRPALRRPSRRPRRSCHRRLRHGRRFSRCLAENVNTLWGVPTSGPPSRSQAVKVFDLFTDTKPNERKLLGDKT